MARRGANRKRRFRDVSDAGRVTGFAPRRVVPIAGPGSGPYPDREMKLQVRQAGGTQELTVGTQKEFLQLWNSGVIAADDLVQRGDRWVRAADLPWIHGMLADRKRDGRRLLWITLALMLAGLAGALWIQAHAGLVAGKSGALPPGAVRAVPGQR